VQNLPADYELESVQPAEVEATFSGPRRAFYFFRPKRLKVIVDASSAGAGRRTYKISEQNIRYPADLRLEEVKPPTLKISLRRLAREGDGVRGG
jgi:YbbR domain-containing protein